MEFASVLQQLIQEEMNKMEDQIRQAIQNQIGQAFGGSSSGTAEEAGTEPTGIGNQVEELKRVVVSTGQTWIIQNPQQAHQILMSLVTILENLVGRVTTLETEKGNLEMLVNELKSRAAKKTA